MPFGLFWFTLRSAKPKKHIKKEGTMNKVIMMGRLTRDPEVRYSAGENPVTIANFSLAVDRRFKRDGQPEADFFNCTAFGKMAEHVEKYYHKGIKVVVEGRLQNDNYQNKDGVMVYRNVIIVEHAEFAESKKAAQQNGTSPAPRAAASSNTANANASSMPLPNDVDGFMNIPDGIDEELPFT